jgi:Flp pilus assembly protein CpaB
VRLTLVGAAETPRLARASAAGRFRLVLRASLDACPRPVAVTALGSRGSRASLPLAGGACVPPPRS